MLKFDFAVLRFDFAVLRFDLAVLRFDFAVLRFDLAVVKFDFVVTKFNPAVMKFDFVVMKFNPVVMKFDFVAMKFNPAVMKFDLAVVKFDLAGNPGHRDSPFAIRGWRFHIYPQSNRQSPIASLNRKSIAWMTSMSVNHRSWLREPLLHFILIGFVLFGISSLWSNRGSSSDQLIAVTSIEVEWLRRNWEARWQRPPTEAELRGLVDDFVRQEVLYREAIAMGLDRDDQVVRNRMVQKLELLTDDVAAMAQPTESELQTYLQENIDRYQIPERRSFTHIYFNVDQRGEAAADAAERLLAELRDRPNSAVRAAELGDRFMLAHDYSLQSPTEVARGFGSRFAEALFALEPGEWQGPVPSGYGWHLVLVTDATESQVPELAQVRNAVLRDYLTSIREQASEALYDGLRQNYEIEIDEDAILTQSMGDGSVSGGR